MNIFLLFLAMCCAMCATVHGAMHDNGKHFYTGLILVGLTFLVAAALRA